MAIAIGSSTESRSVANEKNDDGDGVNVVGCVFVTESSVARENDDDDGVSVVGCVCAT